MAKSVYVAPAALEKANCVCIYARIHMHIYIINIYIDNSAALFFTFNL